MTSVSLTKVQLEIVKMFSQSSSICGKSSIRVQEDRKKNLVIDNMVGQLGTAAVHKLWYGNLDTYVLSRLIQDRTPHKGDNGIDLPPFNIDVKSSLIRNNNKDLLDYYSIVRPLEMHQDWIYVTCLVPSSGANTLNTVYVMGWAVTKDFPSEPDAFGLFKGAYTIRIKDLRPWPLDLRIVRKVMPDLWDILN